jgi:plastocyanin
MRLRYSILFPAVLFALGACGGGGGDSSNGPSSPTSPNPPSNPNPPAPPGTPVATDQVEVGNDLFSPASITVPVNTTVHWTWSSDAREHNVTGANGLASGDKVAGDSYDKLFATAGTFAYHCTIHATMTGSVLVTE